MRKLLAFLLVLALMFPAIALANTQYSNEAMRLSLLVPDGWTVQKLGFLDTITNFSSQAKLTLIAVDTSDAELLMKHFTKDELAELVAMVLDEDVQVRSFFNHTSADNPITGITFAASGDFSVPMTGTAWFYLPTSDAVAIAILLTSADNPPDVSWFTDALDAQFPALTADHTNQYTNKEMRLNLTVPDGWKVEKYGPLDTFSHLSSLGSLILTVIDTPNTSATIPFLTKEDFAEILDHLLSGRNVQVLSHFSHTAGDDPIAGVTFISDFFPIPTNGIAWLYPSTSDTSAVAILLTPPDDPPDVLWFTNALHTLFPALSTAHDTQYTNETMGLSLTVPDGWIIEHGDGEGSDMIYHALGETRMVLAKQDFPNAKRLFQSMNQDNIQQALPLIMQSESFELLSFSSHATADRPIAGFTFTDMTSFAVPMNGTSYFYPCGDDTLAAIVLVTPIADPLDVSWFTDAMAAMFPALGAAE